MFAISGDSTGIFRKKRPYRGCWCPGSSHGQILHNFVVDFVDNRITVSHDEEI